MVDGLPLEFVVSEREFCFRFSDAMLACNARKLFVFYLEWQVPAQTDLGAVELVFGELLSNVVRHAPGPVEVRVMREADGIRLEVCDYGPGYELHAELPQDTFAESHRGLFIVSAYADDLHVERRGHQTVTAARIPFRA